MFALVTVAGQAQTKNYTIQGNLSEVAKATAKQGVSFDSVTIGIERVRDPDYPLSSSLATSCLMATTRCL